MSQSSVTAEPGKSLAISCRDNGGQPVTWKGPKGPLSANTKPKIQDTSIGKLLVFSPTRIQDTGNYTCSLMNNKNEFGIFALVVEAQDSDPEQHKHHSNNKRPHKKHNDDTDTTSTEEVIPEPEETPSPTESRSNRKHTRKPHKHNRHPPVESVLTTTEDDTDTTVDTDSSTNELPHNRIHSGHYRERFPVSEEPLEFKDTPEIQRGKEGDNITLRCEVNKPIKISWVLNDGKDISETKYKILGDGLLILNVGREDNRTFICEVVKSSTGQVMQKKIKFIVEHKPILVKNPSDFDTEPAMYEQDEEVYGFLGETVNLTCEVAAEPPPKFEWSTKQGQKKIGRILTDGPLKSILQLKMTEESPDKYQCLATNKHGKLRKFLNLQIGTKPESPGNIQLKKAGSDNLELTVEVPEPDAEAISNGMEPKWLNIFYRNEQSEEWDEQIFNVTLETFTLTELNSSTKYEVMAAIRNVAGMSDYSNITFFETTSASSVQINNLSFFSVALINTLILLTSRLA